MVPRPPGRAVAAYHRPHTGPPTVNLISMEMILHEWNLDRELHLIHSVYDALPPGGAFVAIEALIDDVRRENVLGLLVMPPTPAPLHRR